MLMSIFIIPTNIWKKESENATKTPKTTTIKEEINKKTIKLLM